MNKVVLTVICLLFTASSALAQAAPDAAELTKLLNEFLAGASRNDPAAHERFWADDLIYTRSAGRRTNKAEIMHDLRSAPAPKPDDPKTVYTAEDIRIQQYGDTAIVAFRLVATTEVDGAKQVQNLLNSGTFLKRNGKWQAVSWQSTSMPRTAEEGLKDAQKTYFSFYEALRRSDTKQVTRLTEPTFFWLDREGKTTTQAQLVEALKVGVFKFGLPEPGKRNFAIYGETAVVHDRWSTMTLVNHAGAWKIVALQTR